MWFLYHFYFYFGLLLVLLLLLLLLLLPLLPLVSCSATPPARIRIRDSGLRALEHEQKNGKGVGGGRGGVWGVLGWPGDHQLAPLASPQVVYPISSAFLAASTTSELGGRDGLWICITALFYSVVRVLFGGVILYLSFFLGEGVSCGERREAR